MINHPSPPQFDLPSSQQVVLPKNLFLPFVCAVMYFWCICVFLYLRIRFFLYLCFCVLCCVFVHLHTYLFMYSYSYFCLCKCSSVYLYLCNNIYVICIVSLYLCVLSWWAEDRSSFSRVRPSLQPALGFSNSLRWRQKANTISETMYWFMKILDSLSLEGLEKIELCFSWIVNLNPSFYSTKTVFKKFSSVVRSRKSWTKVRREVQNAI